METLRKGLDKVLEFVCCVLLGLMTIFATWQVASRYVFNKPSTVTEELCCISRVCLCGPEADHGFGLPCRLHSETARISVAAAP